MTNLKGGRETAASREVVIIRDDGDVVERPRPLPELGVEEAEEWVRICNAVPATYFPPATWVMLAQYCRHVVVARHLWQLIERMSKAAASKRKRFDLARYRQLIREHRAEGVAIYACLRSMRLTHLSSYNHDRAPLPEATPKPWLS